MNIPPLPNDGKPRPILGCLLTLAILGWVAYALIGLLTGNYIVTTRHTGENYAVIKGLDARISAGNILLLLISAGLLVTLPKDRFPKTHKVAALCMALAVVIAILSLVIRLLIRYGPAP